MAGTSRGPLMPDPTSADPVDSIPLLPTAQAVVIRDLRAELDALRAQIEDYKHGSAHEAEEADRLRGERNRAADFRADIDAGADIADWLHAENIALRARLVQTEAVVQAVRAYFVEPDVAADRYQDVIDALATLPEAPPVAAGSGK